MEQLKHKLETIALKYLSKNSLHGIGKEEIQPKKLSNVRAIHNIGNEEVLLLYDDTLFGSAKDGMVFTQNSIFWRERLGRSRKLDYREIVESTANKEIVTKTIFVLEEPDAIEIKDVYYDLISDLRVELINSMIVYETYYQNSLKRFEERLEVFQENKEFHKSIEWVNKYQGLFLNQSDQSATVRQLLFNAYLNEKEFIKAEEVLEFLEEKDSVFYEKATGLLKHGIKEERYQTLDAQRLKAIAQKDFDEAYILFEQQRNLNIRLKDDLSEIELEIKENHYKSLNQKRKQALAQGEEEKAYDLLEKQKNLGIKTPLEINELKYTMKLHQYELLDLDRVKAIEQEEYDIAFNYLEKQRELGVKQVPELDEIKASMELSKKQVLKKHHETLKGLIEGRDLLEGQNVIDSISKIEPSYPLEREKILLMIYNYKFEQAKEAIRYLQNSVLKMELEEAFQINKKALYKEIRDAARSKQYGYFEARPNVWNYKDEYGMSALDYFALEADEVGLLKALEKTELSFMYANIFGHNFIDLIGFAYDASLGDKKGSALELLEKIRDKVEHKQIEDRISFLQTGEEGYFFSYGLSEKERLWELNKKLISYKHFKYIKEEIANKANNQVDNIIKVLFGSELEALEDYPEKDEFETSEDYKNRCLEFKKQYLDRVDFIEEYKRQNQSMVDSITALLENKKKCFIPDLLAWIEDKDQDLQILKLLDLYFPIKAPPVELGRYNPDKEVFYCTVNNEAKRIHVPLEMAENFKEIFDGLSFFSQRFIKDGAIIDAYIYQYRDKKMVLPFLKRKFN